MLFLAVSGAVLMVWLAVMRGSAQRARSFIPQAESRRQIGAPPLAQYSHIYAGESVGALGDATIPEADIDEALAAAAALWGVLTCHRS